MRQVIITGANGFVGSNIVVACLAAGFDVAAVDLCFDNPAYAQPARDNLRLIETDCVNLPPVTADALIHAAFVTATPEERGESPELNLRANLEPLLAVLEYAQRQRIARVICVSSAAVHSGTTDTLVYETLAPRPLGVYGVAKTLMEHTVETMRQVHGRDCLCVRPGSIYGPFEFIRSTRPRLSAIARMIQSALAAGEINVDRPQERIEWTFAPDIGRALVALLKSDSLNYALYQLASGEHVSNLAVARMIQRALPGLTLRVNQPEAGSAQADGRPRILDTERLRQDTGFRDWTTMSSATLKRTCDSIARAIGDA
ncbi:MAG: NAD(P)-dependent oxidoreductase [Chloroflexi bacterium]|nr:NAD(P)-dependent oxidoreductase [Chloroflexota bacterium]